MRSWRSTELALLLGALALSGCAELKPLPELKGMDPALRQVEVSSRRIETGWFTVHSGGAWVPYGDQFWLAEQFKASRCPEAEKLAREWDSKQKWVMTSFIAGALFVVGSQFPGVDRWGFGVPGIGLLALSVDLDVWSRTKWMAPAGDRFNQCMDEQAARP